MSGLVGCFERLIHSDWWLKRDKGEWILSESQAKAGQNAELRIHGGPSLAFSLDKPGANPWPFLNEATHAGIRSICDALVIIEKDGFACVIAVEMKTKDEGNAENQIENGRLLLQWLFDLLNIHGHWRTEYQFCGVISFKPRRLERKGTTARTTFPKPETSRRGYPIFRLLNHPRLNLIELISHLDNPAIN